MITNFGPDEVSTPYLIPKLLSIHRNLTKLSIKTVNFLPLKQRTANNEQSLESKRGTLIGSDFEKKSSNFCLKI